MMLQRVRHDLATERQKGGSERLSSLLTTIQLRSGRARADSLHFPWPPALSLSPSPSLELGVGGQAEGDTSADLLSPQVAAETEPGLLGPFRPWEGRRQVTEPAHGQSKPPPPRRPALPGMNDQL